MNEFRKRVHIVPTTLDDKQVSYLFDKISADRVYVLDNKQPVGLGKEVEGLPLERIKNVVENKTGCYGSNEVISRNIDFYHYQNALIDCFDIIYKEKMENNEVIVNLAGGTKPVAIALAFACSLANAGRLFYVANRYKQGDEEDPVAAGPYTETFGAKPLTPLNITNVIPQKDNKRRLLKGLLELDGPAGVTEILSSSDVITATPPSDENEKEERNRVIQRHHRYAGSLAQDGLLEKHDSKYILTDTGHLIAELVSIMLKHDEQY